MKHGVNSVAVATMKNMRNGDRRDQVKHCITQYDRTGIELDGGIVSKNAHDTHGGNE